MSCSHWWHAPIYIAATVALIIAALSSSDQNSDHLLPFLHRSDHHLAALLLLASPSPALHVSSPFTLFALPDPILSSLTPAAAGELLRRHASPLHLPLSALSILPRGSQIPTLIPDLNLTLTLTYPITINGVPISHPDLFVSGPHVIHGISSPFPLSPPPAAPAAVPAAPPADPRLDLAINALGRSEAYVAFALGLYAVLDSLMASASAPEKVTVFAPRDDGRIHYVAMAQEEMERAVRRHVAVGRFGYRELKEVEEVVTVAGERLVITGGEGSAPVEVNGVQVVEAEVYGDEGVVVHGIARDFGDAEVLRR